MKISIIGATGYGGVELMRLLSKHPDVKIHSIHSQSMNNYSLSDLYPHFSSLLDLPLEEINEDKIISESDVVILATPSGVSKKLALPFVDANFPVIDLSGDFRLKKIGQYEKWYGNESAPHSYTDKAEYGLAEFRDNSKATFIANPGCYATATLLSLAPLIQEDWVDLDSIIVDAKSGISGAGKVATANTHFTETNENMTLYKPNQHQHIPEIVQQLKKWNKDMQGIQFSTSLIPVTRGIFVTTYAKAKKKITTSELHQLYENAYLDKQFVRIQKEGFFPNLKQVQGSNFCDIGVSYNEITNTVMLVTVIDNLVKGAAGQAIQNLNIMGNFDIDAGLNSPPMFP